MRWWVLIAAACSRTPPSTDGHFTSTRGDDDDATGPCAARDADDDGSNACDDCDDDDPDTYPGADERCDGRDNDCDGDAHPEESTLDCSACDDAGFWHGSRDLESDALVAALQTLTDAHFCSDYSAATTFMFVELDLVAGEVECVYTGRTTPIVGGEKPEATDMNTEHSWPQSLGADTFPAECDLHHLYPTDSSTNGTRSNFPFGEVSSDSATVAGGSRFGTDASGATVFEPRDVHKGNAARSMLYFSMRYGYPLSAAELSLYKAWSEVDPVDDVETARSEAIAARQGAANPYVVCPWLVDAR